MTRPLALVAACLTLAATTSACAVLGGDDGPSIVVYNAQHEELLAEIAPKFTKKTGIEVDLRNGSDSELAAQLVEEGDRSPADVFLTENSPAMSAVERAGLLEELDPSLTEPVPAPYRPSSGRWTGFVARSTVLVYNKAEISEKDLPTSLLDLAEPEWKGKVSFSPTGADFQAIVAAVIELEGQDKAMAWLEGLKANGTVYDNNLVVLEGVDSGETATGIEYHYYWYRDQAESGDISDESALHFFGGQDPGAFLSVSGAGVLESSENKTDAEKFIAYLVSEEGQQALADSYALEYPLNPAVQLDPPVKPFDELDPPRVDVSDLDNDAAVDLLTQVGFL